MADASEKDGGLIPKDQACRLLMITPQWLNRLQSQGYIPTSPRGKVSLVGAVQGYIKSLKDEERRSTKNAAESRVRDARASEIELRTAERSRDLVSREEAERAVDHIFGQFKAELIGIPARVTRDLALRRKLEDEIDGALERGCTRIGEARGALRAGRDLDAAVEAPDAG